MEEYNIVLERQELISVNAILSGSSTWFLGSVTTIFCQENLNGSHLANRIFAQLSEYLSFGV